MDLEMKIIAIFAGISPVLGFVMGRWHGYRSARREHRREIEAGLEYLDALDEATRDCAPGLSMSVSLVVQTPARPPLEGRAHLRDVQAEPAPSTTE